MKKVLIFLLLIAMLCMVGCDKDNNANVDTTPVGGITEPTEAPTEAHTEAPTEDPYAGWIRLMADVYIPELPFSDWGEQNQDNIRCYTIFIKSNNSAAFHEYAQSLPDFGYTIEQTQSYSYEGTDPNGKTILLTDFENGQMQINIYY